MRILYFVRLFSGLENSLVTRTWQPIGVPTIVRMIEHFDAGADEMKLVFACKDYGDDWQETEDQTFMVEGLNTRVTVLAGNRSFPGWTGKLRSRLSTARQLWALWHMSRTFKPDLIYIDRGNQWLAAWMSRLTNTPVVWRVMGVLPSMWSSLTSKGWRAALDRWAFRSPFAGVICTLDGSGGGTWMERALRRGVRRALLVNGVDRSAVDAAPNNPSVVGKTVILFVGRLEENKGCEEFLEAFAKANARCPGCLHAVIVGDGSLKETLHARAAENGCDDALTLTGGIDSRSVMAWQKTADLYVSLNRMGNMSNANLEAFACGACVVMPVSDPTTGTDLDTDERVPEQAAYRFGRVDDVDALAGAMILLHEQPQMRADLSRHALACAETLIPTWSKRVEQECAFLDEVVS